MVFLVYRKCATNALRYWKVHDAVCSAIGTSKNTPDFPHPYGGVDLSAPTGIRFLIANNCKR